VVILLIAPEAGSGWSELSQTCTAGILLS